MELIKQLITILASALFTFLLAKYPNFPIDRTGFINLILWVIGLFGIINGVRMGIFRTKLELQGYKFKNYFKYQK